MHRFGGGLVFKTDRPLYRSTRLESNEEEEGETQTGIGQFLMSDFSFLNLLERNRPFAKAVPLYTVEFDPLIKNQLASRNWL